jgi:hypothetical protein
MGFSRFSGGFGGRERRAVACAYSIRLASPPHLRKSGKGWQGLWGTLFVAASGPKNAPNENALNEERFDVVPGLRREWMIVVRRRRLVALGLVSALVGATIYNYTLRPVYEGFSVVAISEAMAANPLARMSGRHRAMSAQVNRSENREMK